MVNLKIELKLNIIIINNNNNWDIETVCTDICLIRTKAEHLGLSLNVSKCEVITSHHIDLSSHMALEGFVQVDIRDASLLGSPLLADRCLDKMLDDKCKELELMMSRVQQLNSHYALDDHS